MSNRDNGRPPYATFSLVFGLLCVPCLAFPLPAPLAVIFGHIALGHFGSRTLGNFGRGRAWLGLSLGYLSLAVFGIFAGLAAIGTWFPPEDAVERIAEEVEIAEPAAQEAPPLPAPVQGSQQDDDVFLAEGDPRYHTFFCRQTSEAQAQRTRQTAALGAGFKPCEVCMPGT